MTKDPLVVLTSDVDWASEHCIQELADFAVNHGIKPTFMATGESRLLRRLHSDNKIELGLHFNFLPASTQGNETSSIIENLRKLYPDAAVASCHSYSENSRILFELRKAGIKYDRNTCLHMQPGLGALTLWTGMVRFPVFWEDDIHWNETGGDWALDDIFSQFLTPGLKILNVHPINFALNVPNSDFYNQVRSMAGTLTNAEIGRLRFEGRGTRTFITELVERLRAENVRFVTLADLYRLHVEQSPDQEKLDSGRTDRLAPGEHAKYWQASGEDKQRLLKDLYEKRSATDPYATSRDYNLRELEITAIGDRIFGSDILDLGCGNGYTLMSLAKTHDPSRMVGVDFSENLIGGARSLAGSAGLSKPPTFVCGDMFEHLRGLPAGSVDSVITERLLINLPDRNAQDEAMREIHRVLRPKGRFLMCEASLDGFRKLNEIRGRVGLETIAETSNDNLSSIRFEDARLEQFAGENLGFRLLEKVGFSEYFLFSRVFHPLFTAPEPPRFRSKINDLARTIQENLPMSPGVGSNVLWLFEK